MDSQLTDFKSAGWGFESQLGHSVLSIRNSYKKPAHSRFTPYNPNEWNLKNVEVPLSGGQQRVPVESGFMRADGFGFVLVTFQGQ